MRTEYEVNQEETGEVSRMRLTERRREPLIPQVRWCICGGWSVSLMRKIGLQVVELGWQLKLNFAFSLERLALST